MVTVEPRLLNEVTWHLVISTRETEPGHMYFRNEIDEKRRSFFRLSFILVFLWFVFNSRLFVLWKTPCWKNLKVINQTPEQQIFIDELLLSL